MMFSKFLFFVMFSTIGVSVFGGEGDLLFGSDEDPDFTISTSDSYYEEIYTALFSNGDPIDWEGVADDLRQYYSSSPGVKQVLDWIDANSEAYAYVICCQGSDYVCTVQVPLSCDNCDGYCQSPVGNPND